ALPRVAPGVGHLHPNLRWPGAAPRPALAPDAEVHRQVGVRPATLASVGQERPDRLEACHRPDLVALILVALQLDRRDTAQLALRPEPVAEMRQRGRLRPTLLVGPTHQVGADRPAKLDRARGLSPAGAGHGATTL